MLQCKYLTSRGCSSYFIHFAALSFFCPLYPPHEQIPLHLCIKLLALSPVWRLTNEPAVSPERGRRAGGGRTLWPSVYECTLVYGQTAPPAHQDDHLPLLASLPVSYVGHCCVCVSLATCPDCKMQSNVTYSAA